MATLETWTPHVRLLRLPEINSEVLLKDVKAALWTIPNATIIESSQLIYTAAAVITEMLDYMMNNHKEQYSPLRKRLKGKLKAAQRKLGNYWNCKKGYLRSPASCPCPEALETVKQRLRALGSCLAK